MKHKQEALAEEASREAKEKKLRALRESAPRFNSPTKAPSGSFENPFTSTFPQVTPDTSSEDAQMDLEASFAAANKAAGSYAAAAYADNTAAANNTGWSTFGPVPGTSGKGPPPTSTFVQGQNLNTTSANYTTNPGSNPGLAEVNPGLAEVLAELKALRAQGEQAVTKSDLANLRQEILKSTGELLDTKLAPLKAELEELKQKQGLLEAKHEALEAELKALRERQGATTTTTTSPFLPSAFDPATKRAAFIGWPDTVAANERFQQMEALVISSFSNFKPLIYLNDYKGPYNNRKLGNVSFVEFGNQDTARNFVKAVEESGVAVETQGKKLLVKQAQTQKQKARNWALRKAEELVKGKPGATGVQLEWKERKVTAGGVDAFTQGKDNLGSFVGDFSDLKLP